MSLLDKLFGKRIPKTNIQKRFELISRHGQGTMSEFWRARDRNSGQTVGLKLLDREKTLRFESRFPGLNKPTEGEIAVQLRHPHIVKTLEHGLTTDRRQFLVMEFITGRLLGRMIKTPDNQFHEHRLQILLGLGAALAHIHEWRFIHRDLCPRNVIINEQSEAIVIDFGLVVPNTPPFCQPGNRTGTANYMAPELIRRRPTDERIDIFSFGVTCFETLTGQLPWEKSKSREAVMQHALTPPTDIRRLNEEIDEALANVIMRGIEVDPESRWQSAQEMIDALKDAAQVGS